MQGPSHHHVAVQPYRMHGQCNCSGGREAIWTVHSRVEVTSHISKPAPCHPSLLYPSMPQPEYFFHILHSHAMGNTVSLQSHSYCVHLRRTEQMLSRRLRGSMTSSLRSLLTIPSLTIHPKRLPCRTPASRFYFCEAICPQ